MKTLLVVDDELLIAESLRGMLAQAFEGRLEVACCCTAAAALSLAERQRVDILLTDINMPGMSGLALHRAMMEKHPQCQVIYLTGYSDFEYARTAVDQHAFAYILKGEGDDVVTGAVERALEKTGPETAARDGEAETEGGDAGECLDRIRLLQEYIAGHLNGDLSLKRLSEVCHLHPVYLSRVFKENTGTTVGEYINRARTEKARDRLRNSRRTVAEIAEEMGFATDAYFCRWFKKQTGMSPQHFRSGKG